MHVNENRIDDTQRRQSALRRLVDAWLRALSTYTPAGPGSLATGQAGAAGQRGACDCADGGHPDTDFPLSYMEFAAPLRQVFWI